MTIPEFSNEFDLYYNNITSNQAPGLNEYEKSCFLTQAQELLILEIYKGTYNKSSFESTEEVTSYINTLVKQKTYTESEDGEGLSPKSVFYTLPQDLWFITYESVILDDSKLSDGTVEAIVRPTTQDSYYSTSRNPFRGQGRRRVLRLTSNNKAELISKYEISSYTIKYIVKPSPIILEDLDNYGTSIDGITKVTECKLNPAIHRQILLRAVQLAKAIWEAGK